MDFPLGALEVATMTGFPSALTTIDPFNQMRRQWIYRKYAGGGEPFFSVLTRHSLRLGTRKADRVDLHLVFRDPHPQEIAVTIKPHGAESVIVVHLVAG
ncbi:hypothetical protein HZZ13_00910 [Bradyrhizobium sp. CNPSo 4010]|uniref:Uncharacterized protein n=1 Tax=Bradyrhizobium agreste TaxID=2751811 RepID=A0ABS0PGQ5_9BRAD|nr:hypothetical protein [Bradyrhizobium agreste]MBH5396376.1 hypothetical protein [Bradyrhizobium agreste]